MKHIFTSALVFAVFLCVVHPAQAHTLETDGAVQGVMHISPSHKPTATEPAHFEFFMSNTSEKFDPKAYTYGLEITGEGMATATVPVIADGSTLRADYAFPKEGEDYTATLTGSSTVSSQPNFTLDFDDIFVYPPGQHEDPIENLLDQHLAHVILVILVILAFGAIVAWDRFVVKKRVT